MIGRREWLPPRRECAAKGCSETTLGELETCSRHLADPEAVRAGLVTKAPTGELRGQCLAGMSFAGADLREANLSYCDLTRCDFSGCMMQGANLEHALAADARFDSADLSKSQCTHACLGGSSLIQVRFSGANLEYASLIGVVAVEAKFDHARLFYTRWAMANCPGTTFAGSHVERAIFRRACLLGADFSEISGRPIFDNVER